MKGSSEEKPEFLAGKLLLAMPSMSDPRFHRAVIFIAAHDEEGAMGMVVNTRMAGVNFVELIAQLNITPDADNDLNEIELPVMLGGPMETERGFVLHSGDFQNEDTIQVSDAFGVSNTTNALSELFMTKHFPKHSLFILGYAGWTPGQLEDEIQRNAWLVADADSDLVFGADDHLKWEKAVQSLGFDPALLSGDAGHA